MWCSWWQNSLPVAAASSDVSRHRLADVLRRRLWPAEQYKSLLTKLLHALDTYLQIDKTAEH